MSLPEVFNGRKLLVYRETATAGTYAYVCGIMGKTFTRTKATSEVPLLDCDDPTAPPVIRRGVGARSAGVAGTGVAARESIADLDADYESDDPHNYRIGIYGELYYQGPFQLTQLEWGADEGPNLISLSVAWESDGRLGARVDDATFGV